MGGRPYRSQHGAQNRALAALDQHGGAISAGQAIRACGMGYYAVMSALERRGLVVRVRPGHWRRTS